ncbi:MAG TPA: response regulator [Alphaproteobacteria bacterium]|nr:response regulator [Alphaproteobacteria bacterium]
MEAVKESAEHHFIEAIETFKADPSGWMAFRFGLSRRYAPETFAQADRARALKTLERAREEAVAFFDFVREKTKDLRDATIWLFADNDILLIARAANAAQRQAVAEHFRALAGGGSVRGVSCEGLPSDLYTFQKIADEKLLSARRMDVYAAMADAARVRSLNTRRKRRADPMVLIVEDDRFTASYTAGVLSKSYDLVHVRTGEEGVIAHIEHAPDVVLLDIHLPGLSGHEVLQAIRAIDPLAFVVMLSVDSEKTGVVSAGEHGAGGFLKKPVSKERLLAAVAKSPFLRKNRRHTPYEREPIL